MSATRCSEDACCDEPECSLAPCFVRVIDEPGSYAIDMRDEDLEGAKYTLRIETPGGARCYEGEASGRVTVHAAGSYTVVSVRVDAGTEGVVVVQPEPQA